MAGKTPVKDKPEDKTPDVKPEEKKSDVPAFDFSVIEVKEAAELPKQERKTTPPNIMAAKVAKSVEAGYRPMEFGPIPAASVDEAKSLMHRAARDAGHGLNVREVPQEDGSVLLVFLAKQEKKTRKYTNDEVRAWVAKQQAEGVDFPGYDPKKRVPGSVTKLYRAAHNIT